MRKLVFLITLLLTFLLVFPKGAEAKKTLPTRSAKSKIVSTTGKVAVSVRFRKDRRAIVVTFANLGSASSVSYMLSYDTRGTSQGASGTIRPTSETSITRELLFGTCSHGVCRYDSGITNAKFVVTSKLNSGKTIVKTFRLKV